MVSINWGTPTSMVRKHSFDMDDFGVPCRGAKPLATCSAGSGAAARKSCVSDQVLLVSGSYQECQKSWWAASEKNSVKKTKQISSTVLEVGWSVNGEILRCYETLILEFTDRSDSGRTWTRNAPITHPTNMIQHASLQFNCVSLRFEAIFNWQCCTIYQDMFVRFLFGWC